MAGSQTLDLGPIYAAAGREWNVDPTLLRAVTQVESGENPRVPDSHAGAQGLAQIMPKTAKALGVTNPYDPQQAIYGMAKLLSQNLDQYGNPADALRAYNAGDPSRWNSPETQDYVPKVAAAYQRLGAQTAPAQQPSQGSYQVAQADTGTMTDAAPAGTQSPFGGMSADDFFASTAGAKPAAAGTLRNGAAAAAGIPPSASPAENPLAKMSADQFFATTAATNSDGSPIAPAAPPETSPAEALAMEGEGASHVPEAVEAFGTGALHGARVLSLGLNKLLDLADTEFPILGRLDAATGGRPKASVNRLTAANQNYDPTYGGNPGKALFGSAGSLAGQAALTAPVLGPVARVAGAVAGGVGNALLGGLGRTVLSRAAQGATYGGGFSGATGGNPLTGAGYGAALGVGAPLIAPTAAGVWNAGRAGVGLIGRGVNALTGQTEADIDAALASRYAPPDASPAPAPEAPARVAPVVAEVPPASPVGPLTTPGGGPTEDAAPWNQLAKPAAADGDVGDVLAALRAGPAGQTAEGASTPLPPKQAAAAQATAEAKRLVAPLPPGHNATIYVPGTAPTLAETAGDAQISLAQKQAYSKNPVPFDAQEKVNNAARQEHFANLAGTPSSVQTMEAARDAQATADLAKAWQAKQPADAAPVVEQIRGIMASPSGKLPPVQDAMQKALAPLYDAQGNLETDPEMLYGARQNIAYLLSKTAQMEKPGLKQATTQLMQVKDALDGVIEQGAPGYQRYLANYAAASKPIDTQTLLQGFAPTIQGPDGKITLGRVQSMLKQLVQQRQLPGVNPAKSIDPDTMDGLFNLRDDLLRKANLDLGKVRGSDTAQNFDMAGQLGMHAVNLATSHVPLAGPAINHLANLARGKSLDSLTNRLLDGSTPPGGYGNQ